MLEVSFQLFFVVVCYQTQNADFHSWPISRQFILYSSSEISQSACRIYDQMSAMSNWDRLQICSSIPRYLKQRRKMLAWTKLISLWILYILSMCSGWCKFRVTLTVTYQRSTGSDWSIIIENTWEWQSNLSSQALQVHVINNLEILDGLI